MIHPTAIIGGPPESREWFRDPGRACAAPVIDPTAILQPFVTVDAGCERATHVGAYTVLMAKAHLGHDAIVEEYCEVAPGAVICGYAILRKGVKVGVNASILPYVCVGEGSTIGAGAVVTRHVPAGETWVGNPAGPMLPREKVAALEGEPVRYRCGCWRDEVDPDCPHHGA